MAKNKLKQINTRKKITKKDLQNQNRNKKKNKNKINNEKIFDNFVSVVLFVWIGLLRSIGKDPGWVFGTRLIKS